MMTSDSAMATTAAVSTIDKTPTYYVVPVTPGSETGISIWYFQQEDGAAQWTSVAADMLEADSQGGNTDQVRLVQPSPQQIVASTNLQMDDLDLTLTLYAAVARTLSASETLPRNYAAGIKPIVTVDVASGTTRSLTLVFTKHEDGQADMPEITQLMSTNEPEIKNGVGEEGLQRRAA